MGYMRHHAIVVSSWSEKDIEAAHAKARALFGDWEFLVSPIGGSPINGYGSFAVFPDGSKEGWSASDEGDACRAALVEWLNAQRYDDGSTSLAWVEVQFGDDDGETVVVSHSDMDLSPSR